MSFTALPCQPGSRGGIGRFLRQGWTVTLFAVCRVAVLVQMVYTMGVLGGIRAMGPSGLVMPSIVIAIAAALLWFSWFARNRGWLGQVAPSAE